MNTAAGANPFPGLRPFQEDEAHLFFGRETHVDAMVDTLAATHFLAVVGSSGSGKSSLVSCGLIPALHRGLMAAAGSGWRVTTCRPGNRPIHALAQALARPEVLPQPGEEESGFKPVELVEATLRMSKLGLLEAYREALPAHAERRNLLVVVDQFEELFRYQRLGAATGPAAAAAGEEAIAFVNLLLEVAAQNTVPVHVVITMRSDFLGECARFHGLPEVINQGQYLVPRMTRDQRRAAIAGPLRMAGAAIDPVLLNRLVNDVGDNPDQLSLLQHALNRTWAHWRADGGQGPVRLAHYQAVGTMASALDQHADEACAELPDAPAQQLCEALFKAITDKGSDARGTRRPTRLDTLCTITGASAEALATVMAPFRDPGRAFLMPPHGAPLQADTPVDISHESLMRVWGRLRGWVDDEAHSAQIYRRLAETAELHANGKAVLLVQPELQVALDWQQRQRPNAAWAGRYHAGFDGAIAFLAQSQAAHDAAQRALVAQREAEAERQQQALRQGLNKRWRRIVLPMAMVALVALGWLYLQARDEAHRAKQQTTLAIEQSRLASGQLKLAEQARLDAEQTSSAYRRLEAQQQTQETSGAGKTQPAQRAGVALAQPEKALVYLQYADPRQKPLTEQLRQALSQAGYGAPAAELVGNVPSQPELRYFRSQDRAAAATLAAQLQNAGLNGLQIRFVPGFDATGQRQQLELWLSRPAGDPVLDKLLLAINADDKPARLTALAQLVKQYAASPEAIDAALGWFDEPRIDRLRSEGRFNMLYFLTRTTLTAWTPALERNARQVVERLLARDKGQAKLGDQSRAELTRLVAVLDAVRQGSAAAAAPG